MTSYSILNESGLLQGLGSGELSYFTGGIGPALMA